jgi:hypothetical protein
MIAEIVSNGMLSLPSALAVVGASLRLSMKKTTLNGGRHRSWAHIDRFHGRICSLHGKTSH